LTARYPNEPALVAALRRSSRLIVDGDRPTWRAITRTPQPCAFKMAISSRSAKDKYRHDSGAKLIGRMPPASLNHLVPTGDDTPTARAASSDVKPSATFNQNRWTCSRCHTGGRPGEWIFPRIGQVAFCCFVIPTI
jgi:hypothetical protein